MSIARRGTRPTGGGCPPWLPVTTLAVALLLPALAWASDEGGGHVDPFSLILVELAAIIVLAGFGRWAASRVGQPAVLGELLAGIFAGNLGVWLGGPLFILVMHLGDIGPIWDGIFNEGLPIAESARAVLGGAALEPGATGSQLVAVLSGPGASARVMMAVALWLFSNLGVILLLFLVGLESSVSEMLEVGPNALLVAILGVFVPLGVGYASTLVLLPEASAVEHLFIGAALTATSVGITAAVLRDLGTSQTRSSKVILGAAVIDDVLGLVILAVAIGIAASGEVHLGEIGRISLLAAIFLGAVMLIGERTAGAGARLMSAFDRAHAKLLFPLGLAFAMAWVANLIGLATIVGAFAAGLILSEKHFEAGSPALETLVGPIERLFAPIFFVLMGMQVDLSTFADPTTLGIAGALTVVAVATKIVAGIAAGQGASALTVGIGMIPRGEVGLIFASVGKSLGVLEGSIFSALVMVVILTTVVTPPLLKWSVAREAS
jgi:Kef-type K+ transport system membrane component KefB